MTKRKRSSEISADEKSRNFSGKGKILEIFLRVRNFFENRGESETEGENASWSQRGMDAPVEHQTIIIIMITDARGSGSCGRRRVKNLYFRVDVINGCPLHDISKANLCRPKAVFLRVEIRGDYNCSCLYFRLSGCQYLPNHFSRGQHSPSDNSNQFIRSVYLLSYCIAR